jgi:MFS family permease
LFLAYILAFADRTVVALLVVPIERDLGLTNLQMGLLQGTAFALFYALFGLPIAWAVDQYSRRFIAFIGVMTWSVMTGMAGLSRSFLPFFLARIGVGAGEATILPSATSLLADYLPPLWRGRALGLFGSGIYIGSGLAYILGGQILNALNGRSIVVPGLGSLVPWQTVLLSLAALGMPVTLAMTLMREPIRRHLIVKKASQGISFSACLAQAKSALISHMVGFTALGFAGVAATVWLPTILVREHEWSPAHVGTVLGLLTIVIGPLGSCIAGVIADRLEDRGIRDGKLLVAGVGSLVAIPAAYLLGACRDPLCILAAAGALLFSSSLLWGLAPAALQEIVHGSALGRVVAIYTAILNLVGFGLGPPAVAVIAKFCFQGNLG